MELANLCSDETISYKQYPQCPALSDVVVIDTFSHYHRWRSDDTNTGAFFGVDIRGVRAVDSFWREGDVQCVL